MQILKASQCQPEDNGEHHPSKSLTSKYQIHIACSYCYKLVHLDDKFNELFKSYLGVDAVYYFIKSMVK